MSEPHNPLEGNRPELTIKLPGNTDEFISIIVVHKDRHDYLNLCLQSISVMTNADNYEIIVVDNASERQDSRDFLDDIDGEVKVVRNQKNLFWSAAANRGVAAANKLSKYFVFLHCDVIILNPGWLDLLSNVSEGQGSGLVGVELQSYYWMNQKIDFVQEWCMLMTRECWEDCGPWAEELPMIGPAMMFTIRAHDKGYKPLTMQNNIAHHCKIFSLDINEYERQVESAMSTLPKLMQKTTGIGR